MPSYHLDIIVDGEDNASGVLHGIGGALGGLGVAITGLVAGGLAALTAGLGVSVSKAMEFDQTMSGLQAVSQATASDMALLSDAAMRIGKDTSFGASDAAAAMEMLSANGLQVTDILSGAADATVNLAAATGLKGNSGLTTAANVATDAMQVFGIQAADMAKAINGISGVTVASKFDINDYALAMAQGGGVAAAVGVEFEDFNTAIAGISNLFSSGSDAGTSFKVMLQRLVPASDPAEQAMRDLGLITLNTAKAAEHLGLSSSASFEQINAAAQEYISRTQKIEKGSDKMGEALNKFLNPFKDNAFFDANGQLKDMAEISGLLQNALSGLSEEKKNDALQTIFGTDAMRAAVGLAKIGEQGFNDLATSIGKVDAAEQARIRLDNLAGDVEALSGSLETAGIQIGQSFTPLLRQLTQAAAEFVNSHLIDRDWSPFVNGAQSAVNVLQGLVNTVQNGAMSLQSAFADGGAFGVLSHLGTWLQPGLTSGITAIQNYGFQLLTWSQAQFPIWLAAMQGYGTAAWQWIVDAAPVALTNLQNYGLQIITWAQTSLPGWLASLQQWGLAAGQWLADAIPLALSQLLEWRNQLIGFVLSSLPGWIDTFAGWTIAAGTWIVDAIPGLLASFTHYTVELIGIVGSSLPAIIDKLSTYSLALLEWITSGTPGAVGELGGYIGQILDAIGRALPGIIEALGRWGGALISWVIDAAPRLLSNFLNLVVNLGSWISERVPIIAGYLAKWVDGFAVWAGEVWPKLRTNLIGMWNTVANWILEYAPVLVTTLAKWAWAFIEFIGPYIPKVLQGLGSLAADMLQWIGTKAPEIAAKLAEWASAFAGWVQNTAWPYLQEKLPILWNNFKQWLSDKAAAISADGSIGRALGDALRGGLEAAWGGLTNLATNIGMSIKDKLGEWFGAFRDTGMYLVQGLWEGMRNSWQSTIVGPLRALAEQLPEPLRRALGIASPSKVMADMVGQWIFPGVVQGAEKTLPQASRDLNSLLGTGIQNLSSPEALRNLESDIAEMMQAGQEAGWSRDQIRRAEENARANAFQVPRLSLPTNAALGSGGGASSAVTNIYVTVQGNVTTERDLMLSLRDALKEDARLNGRAVF